MAMCCVSGHPEAIVARVISHGSWTIYEHIIKTYVMSEKNRSFQEVKRLVCV